MRRVFIGLPIYIGFMLAAAFGFPGESVWMPDWLLALDEWFGIVRNASASITHKTLFIAGIGFALAFYVFPFFGWVIWRQREYTRFYDDLYQLGRTKAEFFDYLKLAYATWRRFHLETPNNVQTFIDQSNYPDWIPVKGGDITKEAKRHGIEAPLILSPNPYDIWAFALELYRQIDRSKYGEPPSLLSADECTRFDHARRDLDYFWTRTGRKIFVHRLLSYRKIKEHLQDDHRFLKILPFLSISLHLNTLQTRAGKQEMYRLGARLFGTRKPWYQRMLDNLRDP